MGWGKIIAELIDVWVRVYQYELKVTGLFQEILSQISFGNFILQNSEDVKTRREWLEWYEKAIKAYGYYCLIPAIAKIWGDKIEEDPNLYKFFYSWGDYVNIRNRILSEGEANGEDLEGIAAAFRDLFSPIVKSFMAFTGNIATFLRDILNSGAAAIWELAKSHKFDARQIVDSVLQRYRDIGNRMRTANIPPEFYYQQRPTFDFDVISLMAHVQAYTAYKAILDKDTQAEAESPISKHLTAIIYIDGKPYATAKMENAGKIKFCLPKSVLDKYKNKPLDVEIGGVSGGDK